MLLAYLGVGGKRRAIDAREQVDTVNENYAIYINVDPLMVTETNRASGRRVVARSLGVHGAGRGVGSVCAQRARP